MRNIAIFGAGGLGREIACLIRMINEETPTWNLIGFFDDNPDLKGTSNEYGKVLGGTDVLNAWAEPLDVVLAMGSPKAIKLVSERITNPRISFPNLIAPGTIFLDRDNISFGKGNIICVGCSFSCNVHVGDFNLFNSFISVGHDTTIGNYNALMPAVRISGAVQIGEENFIGCAAVILQQIKIGRQTTIGANATVLRKTKDGNTYMGTPATIVKF
jgi:sugar O-acyltransferase (sialic acid O-acetyltransferase NeuD family)